MATESQAAAYAKLAADTKTACATSADITKAAAAKAKAAGKPAAKGICYCAKAAVAANTFYFSVAGGVILGVVAYHLVKKVWLNSDDTTEQNSAE